MKLKKSSVIKAALNLKESRSFCTDDSTMKEAAEELLESLGVEVEDDAGMEIPWGEKWKTSSGDHMISANGYNNTGKGKIFDISMGMYDSLSPRPVCERDADQFRNFIKALVEHHNKTLELLGPGWAHEVVDRFWLLREHYNLD